MSRLVAALADRYRIERELGAGGMATVYLAHDLKHDRKVAVKVMRPELAAVIGADRFLAEIKTTANLQHPHILPLHDSGTVDGTVFYVMPFVEGETLRDQLTREKQLGVEDAVRVACEVADALGYAHEHGIIHRDIKPENILLQRGHALVADFGIALAASRSDSGSRMTETGMSLGTPTYMSPEQAMGERDIDARTDTYALGCVLYEMLTGEAPFSGPTAQAIVAKVMTDEPRPPRQLRRSVPPNVEAAVLTALEKVPADRFPGVSQFAAALRDPNYSAGVAARASTPGVRPRGPWNWLTIAMAATAAVLAVVAGWALMSRSAIVPRPVFRTTIGVPDSVQLAASTFGSRLAISRTGNRVVFVGFSDVDQRRHLWLRVPERLEAVPLPGTDSAFSPFFSPDGTRVGFFTSGQSTLRTVSLSGGLPTTVADTGLNAGSFAMPAAAAWGMDGAIYVGSPQGVQRIPEDGGSWTFVSRPDSSTDEKGHWPVDVLPNGRGLIITIAHLPTTMQTLFDIAVLDLRTGQHRVLARGIAGRYLAPGFLVFVRADGELMAAPFDQDRLELTGPQVPVSDRNTTGQGFREFALSADGTLLYLDHTLTADAAELIWMDRHGAATPLDPSWRADFESVALSPNGRQLAAGVLTRDGGAEVWIGQLPGGPHAKLTTDGPINYRPSWLPGGNKIAFRTMNTATGQFELVAKRADGLGPTERLAREARSIATGFVSPDGQWRIFRVDATEKGRGDILGVRAGDSVPTPLVATPAEERYPTLSPNGRWLAYRSDEGGTADIWVRPFPNVGDGRWQVSVAGGTEPVWSHSGKELFYLTPANELVSATVTTEPPFAVHERRVLFSRPATIRQNIATAAYDVSPDDSRFVMIQSSGIGTAGLSVGFQERLVLVDNWIAELKARVPR